MPIAGPEDLDLVISACEAITRSAEKLLTRCRRRRNSVLPISQLPTELMMVILKESLTTGIKYYLDLRTLRLVSKRSDIIWDCPLFWTTVLCDSPLTATALALERSQGLPLDIKFLCREIEVQYPKARHHHEAFVELVDDKFPRWRSVTLDVVNLDGMEKYLGDSAENAPIVDPQSHNAEPDLPMSGPALDRYRTTTVTNLVLSPN